jgi:hypothetical protein
MLNPPAHVFSSLLYICPMPVDLDKFCMDLLPGARWAYRLPPIVIICDLNEKAGAIDKLIKWNQLTVPSKSTGCLENLYGHKCFPTTIGRCHIRQDTMS